jgi:glycine betaine/proline transport system substrate-binding protein
MPVGGRLRPRLPRSASGRPLLTSQLAQTLRLPTVALSLLVGLCACSSGPPATAPSLSAPAPGSPRADCGRFTIAYDPTNGYEASAFIVGRIAAEELGCSVTYLATSTRQAWQTVASGRADVYLDAYGSPDLRRRLAGPGGPVTVLGPNGVLGGVDMLAPAFMAARGLRSSRDLDDVRRIGWGHVRPTITTVRPLVNLARAFVQSQHLDYRVHDYDVDHPRAGAGDLVQQVRRDDADGVPNVYLVAAPRQFLGDGTGRASIDIPESAAEPCRPAAASTVCSLTNFRYLRIVNSQFAHSDSPAYNLVYHYHLKRAEAVNVLEIVALSGYDVRSADAAAWINTHHDVWIRWLP